MLGRIWDLVSPLILGVMTFLLIKKVIISSKKN